MRAKGVATSITTQLHGDNIMKPTARSLYNQPTRARELNHRPVDEEDDVRVAVATHATALR